MKDTISTTALTVIKGRPNNLTLKTFQLELNTFSMSHPSNRGGGLHGLLTLVVTPATYLTVAGVAFDKPDNPGVAPVHRAIPTSYQINETNQQYKADVQEYNNYLTVSNKIKRMIIEAVDDKYINTLSDAVMGYGFISALTIITHLHTTYGAR